MAQAAGSLGGLDILWCNAGVLGPGNVENFDPAAYDAIVAINMTAPIRSCGTALAHLRGSPAPAIVLTASTAGLVGAVSGAVYSATKSALVGYTKSLALRVAADNIRVNAICPGPVHTPMMSHMFEHGAGGLSGTEYRQRVLASVPLARVATPEEIAEAALWLASPRASYVTGVALAVDGGYTAR